RLQFGGSAERTSADSHNRSRSSRIENREPHRLPATRQTLILPPTVTAKAVPSAEKTGVPDSVVEILGKRIRSWPVTASYKVQTRSPNPVSSRDMSRVLPSGDRSRPRISGFSVTECWGEAVATFQNFKTFEPLGNIGVWTNVSTVLLSGEKIQSVIACPLGSAKVACSSRLWTSHSSN